jgi:hypothetical protein
MKVSMATITYEAWLEEVDTALKSVNMARDQWQSIWPFDFQKAFAAGVSAHDAAEKANRFWWRQQNVSVNQQCLKTPDCWLPQNHHGNCQSVRG